MRVLVTGGTGLTGSCQGCALTGGASAAAPEEAVRT